jgi:hypothetical protein
MFVNLEKSDLIALVKGSYVPYELFSDPLFERTGFYTDYNMRWNWKAELEKLTESELLQMYETIKEHNKKKNQ